MTHRNDDVHQSNYMSALAGIWWDRKNPMFGLRALNRVRVPFVCEQLEQIGKINDAKSPNALEGLKILDVGCGGGFFSEEFARLGAKIVGIDPVEKMIETAKKHAATQNDIKDRVEYFSATIEEHASEFPGFYDVIVCSEVIEHVSNQKSFMDGCAKALKSNGDVFFSTPNRTIASFLIIYLIGEMILNLVPRFCHNFAWFVHEDTLAKMLLKHGICKMKVKGYIYIPIVGIWISFGYTGLFYIMHGTRIEKS